MMDVSLLLLLPILLLLLSLPLTPLAPVRVPDATAEQQALCFLVNEYRRAQFSNTQEPNRILRILVVPPNSVAYENRFNALFPDNRFTNWVGTVSFAVRADSVSISFIPDCGAPLQLIQFLNTTKYPGIPPEDSRTLVDLNSPLASILRNAPSNMHPALVSGELVPFSATRLNPLRSPSHGQAPQRGTYKSPYTIPMRASLGPLYVTKVPPSHGQVPRFGTYEGRHTNPIGASLARPRYLTKFTSISLLPPPTSRAALPRKRSVGGEPASLPR